MTELKEKLTDEEADHLIDLKMQAQTANPRMRRHMRRQIRYRIFRIREGRNEFDKGLKKLIESQLEGRDTLEQFTFSWDIAPNDPLKVVSMFEWEAKGGKFDMISELCDDGITRQKRICSPTAFTQQE